MDETAHIFSTYHNGFVRRVGDRFFFIEKPNFPGIEVGDELPDDWELVPANEETLAAIERQIPDNDPLSDDNITLG
jgi:hypothetical protein